jgi:hypothetical protein
MAVNNAPEQVDALIAGDRRDPESADDDGSDPPPRE